MSGQLDVKQALRVFAKMTQHGQKREDEYYLQGLWGSSNHDGYTVYLRDELVKVQLGFHNTFHADYRKSAHFDAFLEKLSTIDKMQTTTPAD